MSSEPLGVACCPGEPRDTPPGGGWQEILHWLASEGEDPRQIPGGGFPPKVPPPSSRLSCPHFPRAVSGLERSLTHLSFSLKISQSILSSPQYPRVSFPRKHADFLQNCPQGEGPAASFVPRPTAPCLGAARCGPREGILTFLGVGGLAKLGGGLGLSGRPLPSPGPRASPKPPLPWARGRWPGLGFPGWRRARD